MTPAALPSDPKQVRELLHGEIERLEGENLVLLHRVALMLELDELSGRLDAGFDGDREKGTFERLPEIIKEARKSLRPGDAS